MASLPFRGAFKAFVQCVVLCLLCTSTKAADPIVVRAISWNLESGDSDASFIADQIRDKGRVDLWGLSEVQSKAFAVELEQAAEAANGSDYELFVSADRHEDKVAILYNKDRFEEVDRIVLESVRLNNAGLRPMLIIHLRGKETGQEFFFCVNHLKAMGGSTNVAVRSQQSKIINDWAETQALPVIICGDFNYGVDVDAPDANQPDIASLTADDVFQWLRPTTLVKTQSDRNFNSVLDFFFVANSLPGWQGESRILEREGNNPAVASQFDDDSQQTDHRPLEAVFTFDADTTEETAEELRSQLMVLNATTRTLESQLSRIVPVLPTESEELAADLGGNSEESLLGAANKRLAIIHIRVGQGDSTLLIGPADTAGNRKTALIDAGNLPRSGFDGGKIVGAVLSKLGITKLDYMIATHYDADHIGGIVAGQEHLHGSSFLLGMDGVPGDVGDDDADGREDWIDSPLTMIRPDAEELGKGDDIRVTTFVDRGDDDPPSSQTFKKYQSMANAVERRICLVDQNQVDTFEIDLGDGAVMRCLAANGFVRGESSPISNVNTENERSLCFLVKYKGFDYLTGGDTIGRRFGQENAKVESAIGKIIDANGIEVDVLHVNHHGANNASEVDFLESVAPEMAIISLGNDNDHHHPNLETLQRLTSAGIYRIYQTAWGTTQGDIGADIRRHQAIMQDDIVLVTDGEKYEISTRRSFGVDNPH